MGDSDLQIPPRWSLHCASNDDTTTFVCSFASSTALAFVLAAASNFVCVHCRHATFYSPDATIGGRMYCTTRASTADAPIGGRMGSNLGARRWQFRWLEPVVSLGREEPYAHLYPE